MKKSDIAAIMCLWENQPDGWKLAHAYPIDDDGYPLVKAELSKSKDSHRNWLEEYKTNEDWPTEIMGRAVTVWTFSDGVRLIQWNPKEWMSELTPHFYEITTKGRRWIMSLEGGSDIYFGTLRAARGIVLT